MVAEDDRDMSHVLEFLLTREGYSVHLARDGREAIRALEQEPFDMVLLDVMMPFASGLQVVRQLRQTAGWEDVPVLIVSGKGAEGDVVNAIEAGATDYLTKPFRPRELVARVRAQVARTRRRDLRESRRASGAA
jgi:DNA-binding response OmpR family regulator